MSLFSKPEIVILKESSDAEAYLNKLENLRKELPSREDFLKKIDREIAITRAGITGEERILFELKNSGMDLVVLHDIYIEDSNGNGAQIDYLVITPYVDVLIECKNLVGNIEINNRGDFIRTFEVLGKKYKEGIYSPITQNERHMQVYKECRKAGRSLLTSLMMEKSFEKYNKSLVVLANPKTVLNDRYAPATVKHQVVRADQLITVLKGFRSDNKTSKRDMLAFGEKILAMNIEERKDYFKKFEALQTELQESVPSEKQNAENDAVENLSESNKKYCPWCGKELVKRTAQKGNNAGKQFWGCSGFPKCRYLETIR